VENLKKGKATGDIAAPGDRVLITLLTDGSGVIEEVEERKRAIVRLDRGRRETTNKYYLRIRTRPCFVFRLRASNSKLKNARQVPGHCGKNNKCPVLIVANKIDLVKNPEEIFRNL